MSKPRSLPSQEYLKECFLYDKETGLLTWATRPRHHFPVESDHRRWNARFSGKQAFSYKMRSTKSDCLFYFQGAISGINYLAHRIVWKLVTGEDPEIIDHKDGNGLNNSWDNLVNSTQSNNQKNHKMASNNTSGRKGVYWSKAAKKWASGIKANGKKHYLGIFTSFDEACKARSDAEDKFGFSKRGAAA